MLEIPEVPGQADVQSALILILKNAVKALGGSAGVVATWSEAESRFIASAFYGLDKKTAEKLYPFLEEAIPDLAGSRRSFDLLSELMPDIILPGSPKGFGHDPVIALPLRIEGRSIGLIYILRPVHGGSFTSLDQEVLGAFAEQAAIAMYNARLAYLLSEEKQRVEAILENTPEGIISIDARRRVLGINSALERLTGYTRQTVIGNECATFFGLRDSHDRGLCQSGCPMLMKPERTGRLYEQEGLLRRKDGKPVDVMMTYSIVRTPEGKPLNAVINVRDVTRFRETENLREAFLSLLGHQIQTPLAIIKGYTGTLARSDGKWDRRTVRQGLRIIEEESDRLSKVMNRLLLASRIAAGGMVPAREPVQIAALSRSVVRRLRRLTDKHRFKTDFSPGMPPALAEPHLIEEVLINLVDNAIKYSPEGGLVTISGRCVAGKVQVSVSDEGIGIPTREMGHLFKRFYRVATGPAHNVQGVGLGLYLCKAIIEMHGGAIRASSEHGKGAKFTFTLPAEGADVV